MPRRSDDEYFQAFLNSDNKLLTEFYDKNQKSFLQFVGKYQLDKDKRCDVYQDAFCTLWENIYKGKITREKLNVKLFSYLCGIGKNLVSKYVEDIIIDELDDGILKIVDDRNDDDIERQEKVDEVIEQLKEPCKSIFNLYYFKHNSLTEIASKLGYKDVTVAKTQKYRCMEKVKSCLRPFYKIL